ncbi:guanine-N(7)-methyltransferase [Microthyrium microscopicum]|uniref:mRNA cap guanine-N(7) methyltransferase n=1 Tax=Microthyrium microscopicum TaxID=703497 RepID=A0A6A6UDU2_9PEZI|nr:guanine-N(7)-methyltransferase [Microthyrium microscopicum]
MDRAQKRKRDGSVTPPPRSPPRERKRPGASSGLPSGRVEKRRPGPSQPRKRDGSVTPPPRSPPRERKRPGVSARLPTRRPEALSRDAPRDQNPPDMMLQRGVHNVVAQHYNAVPERGRAWRQTDSKIKGLRSFNNWVKSVLIQKCAPKEDGRVMRNAKVLDIGCGKGGDLMKWQKNHIELYVGIDPADVSIDQARDRYEQMKRKDRRLFHGEFIARDGFGQSLDGIDIVMRVGFDKGLDARWGGGGFDIVSMMFCMHYAFETEAKARQMLQNVAGALRKGGRFLGVIPNSDALSERVEEYYKKHSKAAPPVQDDEDDDWDPEKSLDTKEEEPAAKDKEESEEIGWGNSIYNVKFPQGAPKDGIFRPPYGHKYFFFLEEAVDEVPEFVVPWEAFRGLAEEYNLSMEYRMPFREVWEQERHNPVFRELSERMNVRDRNTGELRVSEEEMEAASFYHAFCFEKV